MFLAIADIHGAYKALKQVLQRSGFNYERDSLICLGDTADGWTQTKECFDELLKIPNLIYIMGNHDFFLYNWIRFGETPEEWLTQGGVNTIYSYVEGVPDSHRRILDNAVYYHILYNNLLFVHGGVDINLPIEAQSNEVLMWDRTLFNLALLQRESNFHFLGMSSIFIGHTATTNIEKTIIVPIKAANVWFLDTGCGWDGRLTGFDILSGRFWQSDLVQKLYNVKEHF